MLHLPLTKVTIILGDGADLVCLHTDLPSPDLTNEPLCLDFRVTKDKGVDYVVYTMGIDPNIVELIRRPRFSS